MERSGQEISCESLCGGCQVSEFNSYVQTDSHTKVRSTHTSAMASTAVEWLLRNHRLGGSCAQAGAPSPLRLQTVARLVTILKATLG